MVEKRLYLRQLNIITSCIHIFAGKKTLLKAAQFVENDCDAVDINLGCPQGIARKGRYGSFLLTETDLLRDIVSTLHKHLKVPVTCKIRILPRLEDTLKLCHALEDAGCQLLTVHGRTKEQNKQSVGSVDWNVIKIIKSQLSIPVFANGGIADMGDVERCIRETAVDGVMTSEAILENPALFCRNICPETGEPLSQTRMATEYIDFVTRLCGKDVSKKEHIGPLKPHLFKFLHGELKVHTDLRSELGKARSMPEYIAICEKVAKREAEAASAVAAASDLGEGTDGKIDQQPGRKIVGRNRAIGELEWYYRYRNQSGVKTDAPKSQKRKNESSSDDGSHSASKSAQVDQSNSDQTQSSNKSNSIGDSGDSDNKRQKMACSE